MYAASRRREPRVMTAALSHNGYRQVALCSPAGRVNHRMSRLVLSAFAGPCPDGMEACHANGVRTDDRVENLRWDTRQANHADMDAAGKRARGLTHGSRTKPHRVRRGTSINTAKLNEGLVREIRASSSSRKELSERYGVSANQIKLIQTRRNWAHVL